ncbi:hypothetical protein [Thioalkalivibrio sp. XN279]|uniref:hypothetical protein n=1 Tax=Thioalkalivibrio sp. XN279 TaxID=2714953 RepID=UPI00140D3C17|nr:hypothetical protein [Thioalkalivibrio sp. XN279]NHA13862.1 hypothetical protein [Thioalkalivibrio sp. XN279]
MIRIAPLPLAIIMLASIFAARAALRLAQAEFYVLHFAVLGWPAWAVWAVSIAELAGALLLLQRATFPAGAILLGLVAGSFTFAYLQAGAPVEALGPGGLLLALGGIAFLRRLPRH